MYDSWDHMPVLPPQFGSVSVLGSPIYVSANLDHGSLLLKNPLVRDKQQTSTTLAMKNLQKIPNTERRAAKENIYDSAEKKPAHADEKPVYEPLMVGRAKTRAVEVTKKPVVDESLYQTLDSGKAGESQSESVYQALVTQKNDKVQLWCVNKSPENHGAS